MVQGDSKRLLKVHVSITSTFYGAGELKFCTKQLKTIQFDTSDETDQNDIKVPLKWLLFFW